MALQFQGLCAVLVWAHGAVLLVAGVGLVAVRGGAGWALVDLGVGVPQPDGDVTHFLLPELDGLDARDGLDDGGLAVGYVADGADVDGGLPADDLQRGGTEGGDVLVVLGPEVGLLIELVYFLGG